ncbi:MAG: choice-of-anchor D domain-containing protein [Imperialibacter sp.]
MESPSTGDSNPRNMVEINGAYFLMANKAEIYRLTSSFQLNRFMPTSTDGSPSDNSATAIAPLKNNIFITHYSFNGIGEEPALVDLTTGNTSVIKDIFPGSSSSNCRNLHSFFDKVYFLGDNGNGDDLWVSDGTPEGTKTLINNESFGQIYDVRFFSFKSTLLFVVNATSLYASDGSMEGTKLLKTFDASVQPEFGTAETHSFIYFPINKGEIWRTNATVEGTELFRKVGTGYYMPEIAKIGDKVVFLAEDEINWGDQYLLSYDEDSEKTSHVKSVPRPSLGGLSSNGQVAFIASTHSLWKSDGTEDGTVEVLSSPDIEFRVYQSSFLNDNFVFIAATKESGQELWVSDGSKAGTHILKDIYPGPLSGFRPGYETYKLLDNSSFAFFQAKSPDTGVELWVSNGTEAATSLIQDINESAQAIDVKQINLSDKELFVLADAGIYYPNLFKLKDGGMLESILEEGDKYFFIQGSNIEPYKGGLYFGGVASEDGFNTSLNDLYRYSEGKVELVKRLWNGNSSPRSLRQINNNLFFTSGNYDGRELWKSSGSVESTTQVKNIAEGYNSAFEVGPDYSMEGLQIGYLNDKYYFAANDHIHGIELWESDLTTEGTSLFMDIEPGSVGSDPKTFFLANGKFYFSANHNGTTKLWVSDGTVENTSIIEQVIPLEFYQIGESVYFLSKNNPNSNYKKLFKINSNDEGVTLIADLGFSTFAYPIVKSETGLMYVARNSSNLFDYYFIDNDEQHTTIKQNQNAVMFGAIARENYFYYFTNTSLWMTDGTSALDLEIVRLTSEYGILSHTIQFPTVFCDGLVFSATTNSNSNKYLWKLQLFNPTVDVAFNSTPIAPDASADFGTIPYTTESTAKTLTITNNGYVDWEFPEGYSLQVSGEAANDFVISNPVFPAVLRPGESFDIDVKFVPTDGGVREAYIDLQSTDELLSSIKINLTGKGTDFPQSIQFVFGSDMPFREAPFELAAYSTSRLPLDFTSSDNSIATFTSEGFVTKKFGTVTIKASQPGNEYFLPATPVEKEVNIIIGNQTIGLNVPTHYTYGDAAFQLSATTSSGNPVKAYTSSNTALMSIEGTTATILGAGNLTVTATVDGNQYFNDGEQVFDFTIKKAPQTISFESLAPTTFGSAVEVAATGGASGQPVVFTSSNESVATVAGNTVTIVKSGNVNITASQAGNDNYDAATSVTRLLTISKGVQTITFEAPEGKTFGDDTFELSVSSSSGLPVTLTSSKPGVAMIEGSTVTILGAGTVTLKASQPGNDSYSSAASVEHLLTINKAAQTITFDVPDVESGDGAVELVAEATSGLAVTFVSSNPDIAKVTGTSLEVLAAGEVEITARQAGNANYLAAEDVSHTLVVLPTGLGDNLADKVQVYPNPAQSYIEVELPDNITKASYRLTQISGQVVKYGDLQLNGGKTKIIVEDIGPGVYLLNISGERYTEVFRVIKN